MFLNNLITGTKSMLLAGILAGSISVSTAGAQSADQAPRPAVAAASTRYQPNRLTTRAGRYYGSVWGIDLLMVKATESGEIVRFTYRVSDAEKAKPLNDKKSEPSLIDPRAGVRLVIPALENVGMLRQTTSTPEVGKSYWMAFSNSGRLVKKGDRVDVVIGQFKAEGLIVE
jgi:hypothetical protein